MHEITVMKDILRIILDTAKKNMVKRIIKVRIETGAFTDLDESWMNRYFKSLTAGTAAHGAELALEKLKPVISCRTCSYEYETENIDQIDLQCPVCGNRCSIIGDSSFRIVDMEVI